MNYTIINPKGIDATVQKLQTYLFDNLNWGNIDVYGRVYKNQTNQKGLMLEAYVGNNEYKDVFTDDTKNANIFFVEDDVHNSSEGIKFTNKLKIVFMVNLKKTYPNITHRADMEAEIQAIELIRNKSGFRFEKLEKGIKQCLGEFYTDGIKLYDMQPYHVFSITGEITYQISCLNNYNMPIQLPIDNGGGGNPDCAIPVITNFIESQFTNAYFITKGINNFLQIQASNNPTLYSYFISFLSNVQGFSLDSKTGLFTINYTGNEETIRLNYTAENNCGQASGSIFLKPVDSNVTILLPPINLVSSGFNPQGMGPSFMLTCKFLPYMAGTITKVEYYKNGIIYKTFQDSYLGNPLGVTGNLMQNMEYGLTYDFKIRVGNSLGEFSEFSETLTVTIPNP